MEELTKKLKKIIKAQKEVERNSQEPGEIYCVQSSSRWYENLCKRDRAKKEFEQDLEEFHKRNGEEDGLSASFHFLVREIQEILEEVKK